MFGQKTQPEWFFDSSIHLEAVSRLLYLVENHEPLGVILGPDGSGRTRVLSRLREELKRSGTQIVQLNLSGMDEEAAFWHLAERMSLRTRPSMRRFELISLLRDELAGRARCEVQTVVLLDDLHRVIDNISVFLRVLSSLNAQCRGMLTVVAASAKSLPAEFTDCVLVPIRLTELDSAESSDFVRSLIGQQVPEPSAVDESAVRAISITSVGNAARMSRLCSLLRVVHEASPETRITEETVYSLLTEFAAEQFSSGPVMRAS